jgi:hypothetical protein
MDLLLSVLPSDGSWVLFETFLAQAQAAGASVTLWRRAKQSGLIETRISGDYTTDGVHEIRKVV